MGTRCFLHNYTVNESISYLVVCQLDCVMCVFLYMVQILFSFMSSVLLSCRFPAYHLHYAIYLETNALTYGRVECYISTAGNGIWLKFK